MPGNPCGLREQLTCTGLDVLPRLACYAERWPRAPSMPGDRQSVLVESGAEFHVTRTPKHSTSSS